MFKSTNTCKKTFTEMKVVIQTCAEKTSTEKLVKHCFNMTTNTTVATGCKHVAHCRATVRSGLLHSVGVIPTAASLVHFTVAPMNPMTLCNL